MKILFLITELNQGGAENCLYSIVKEVIRHPEFNIAVTALFGDGPVATKIRNLGVPVSILGCDSPLTLHRLSGFSKTVQHFAPDILHTFLFHANLYGKFLHLMNRNFSLISSIRVAEKGRAFHPVLEALTWGLSDIHVCVSNRVSAFMNRRGIPSSRLMVIPNGVDTQCFRPPQARRLPADREIRLLSVARLTRQKRLEDGIRILSELARTHPVTYTIAGAGEDEQRLRDECRKYGVASQVHFAGHVAHDQIPSLMAEADIFILPSRWEGMPNSLLEAAACGLPCVAYDVEGISEILSHNHSGLLVPPGEQHSLAQAVESLIKDSRNYERISRNARQAALARPVDKFTRKYVDLYRTMNERKQRSSHS